MAALFTSHMNGLIPFERKIEQKTEPMNPLAPTHACLQAKELQVARAAITMQPRVEARKQDCTPVLSG